MAAYGQDIVRTGKYRNLSDPEFTSRRFYDMKNGEQGMAILLYLWPLVPDAGILHSQGVQVELPLHLVQLAFLRIMQRYPHEAIRAAHVLVNFVCGDFGGLSAILIDDAAH